MNFRNVLKHRKQLDKSNQNVYGRYNDSNNSNGDTGNGNPGCLATAGAAICAFIVFGAMKLKASFIDNHDK